MHDGVYSVGDGVTMRIQGADRAMRASPEPAPRRAT